MNQLPIVRIKSSTDLDTWTTTDLYIDDSTETILSNIIYAESKFIFFVSKPTTKITRVYSSSDGISWSSITLDEYTPVTVLSYSSSEPLYIGVGGYSTFTALSVNATDWFIVKDSVNPYDWLKIAVYDIDRNLRQLNIPLFFLIDSKSNGFVSADWTFSGLKWEPSTLISDGYGKTSLISAFGGQLPYYYFLTGVANSDISAYAPSDKFWFSTNAGQKWDDSRLPNLIGPSQVEYNGTNLLIAPYESSKAYLLASLFDLRWMTINKPYGISQYMLLTSANGRFQFTLNESTTKGIFTIFEQDPVNQIGNGEYIWYTHLFESNPTVGSRNETLYFGGGRYLYLTLPFEGTNIKYSDSFAVTYSKYHPSQSTPGKIMLPNSTTYTFDPAITPTITRPITPGVSVGCKNGIGTIAGFFRDRDGDVVALTTMSSLSETTSTKSNASRSYQNNIQVGDPVYQPAFSDYPTYIDPKYATDPEYINKLKFNGFINRDESTAADIADQPYFGTIKSFIRTNFNIGSAFEYNQDQRYARITVADIATIKVDSAFIDTNLINPVYPNTKSYATNLNNINYFNFNDYIDSLAYNPDPSQLYFAVQKWGRSTGFTTGYMSVPAETLAKYYNETDYFNKSGLISIHYTPETYNLFDLRNDEYGRPIRYWSGDRPAPYEVNDALLFPLDKFYPSADLTVDTHKLYGQVSSNSIIKLMYEMSPGVYVEMHSIAPWSNSPEKFFTTKADSNGAFKLLTNLSNTDAGINTKLTDSTIKIEATALSGLKTLLSGNILDPGPKFNIATNTAVTRPFAMQGDGGSLIFDNDMRPMSLIVGGSPPNTRYNSSTTSYLSAGDFYSSHGLSGYLNNQYVVTYGLRFEIAAKFFGLKPYIP